MCFLDSDFEGKRTTHSERRHQSEARSLTSSLLNVRIYFATPANLRIMVNRSPLYGHPNGHQMCFTGCHPEGGRARARSCASASEPCAGNPSRRIPPNSSGGAMKDSLRISKRKILRLRLRMTNHGVSEARKRDNGQPKTSLNHNRINILQLNHYYSLIYRPIPS